MGIHYKNVVLRKAKDWRCLTRYSGLILGLDLKLNWVGEYLCIIISKKGTDFTKLAAKVLHQKYNSKAFSSSIYA